MVNWLKYKFFCLLVCFFVCFNFTGFNWVKTQISNRRKFGEKRRKIAFESKIRYTLASYPTLTRYKYLHVSLKKKLSIRSSWVLSLTLCKVAYPHLTKNENEWSLLQSGIELLAKARQKGKTYGSRKPFLQVNREL